MTSCSSSSCKANLAEFLGTFFLVFGGVGAAVIGGPEFGLLGIALAFGLSVMAAAYTFGPISGGHFNPAITLGLTAAGKSCPKKAIPYIVAQILGGTLGAAAIYLIMQYQPGFDASLSFASNGYGDLSPYGFGLIPAFITEFFVTMIFTIIILGTTKKEFPPAVGGFVVGLSLTLLILVSGLVTNASLNPARSFATAVFQGGLALNQLWLFFVAPPLGALVAGFVNRCFCKKCGTKSCETSCEVTSA